MAGVIVKPVKVFTRENPCTKVDLWNCFRRGAGFVKRAVVESRGEIGLNAPKYLLREGFTRAFEQEGIDYIELTPHGEQWLTDGLERHLKKHPGDRRKCRDLPGAVPASNARARRIARAR